MKQKAIIITFPKFIANCKIETSYRYICSVWQRSTRCKTSKGTDQ